MTLSQHRVKQITGIETRLKQITSFENRLTQDAKRLRAEAEKLPYGAAREGLLEKACQAETGAHISAWLSSSGLQPPK